MTAKEKAIEIYSQFKKQIKFNCQPSTINGVVKQCAIIHVKGIIEELESIRFRTSIGRVISYEGGQLIDKIQYWRDVLTELNQM